MSNPDPRDEAFTRFVRRMWTRDIAPLLRGRRAKQRRTTARVGGTIAGLTGTALDKLFGLRGRPFARALTVVGSTVGAILPDAWDWNWLMRSATPTQRSAAFDALRDGAAALPHREALELLGLKPGANADELHRAWRALAAQWHPDKARDPEQRAVHTARFVAYQAAYDALVAALDRGELNGGGSV